MIKSKIHSCQEFSLVAEVGRSRVRLDIRPCIFVCRTLKGCWRLTYCGKFQAKEEEESCCCALPLHIICSGSFSMFPPGAAAAAAPLVSQKWKKSVVKII